MSASPGRARPCSYLGARDEHGLAVVVIHKPTKHVENLNPRLDIANKSPSGLECGYDGSGPAQLALAILADLLGVPDQTGISHWDRQGTVEIVERLYQRLKAELVATLPRDSGWEIDDQQIVGALKIFALEPHFREAALGALDLLGESPEIWSPKACPGS